METEQLTTLLPYILGAVGCLLAVLILISFSRRKGAPETKSCPHCLGMVDPDEIVCGHCNRKVSNRKI